MFMLLNFWSNIKKKGKKESKVKKSDIIKQFYEFWCLAVSKHIYLLKKTSSLIGIADIDKLFVGVEYFFAGLIIFFGL